LSVNDSSSENFEFRVEGWQIVRAYLLAKK